MNKLMRKAKALGERRLASKPSAGPCTACNGSGHYDHDGSPTCTSCAGTGKQRAKP